jgi:hypothetical protein
LRCTEAGNYVKSFEKIDFIPEDFYKERLETLNLLLMAGFAIDMMHTYQGALLLQGPSPPELGRLA